MPLIESPSIANGLDLPVIRAAGVIFVCGAKALFLQRSNEGDHGGEWCWPGGKIEEGESAEEAAKRECREEIGRMPKGDLVLHARKISTGILGDGDVATVPTVDYTTFVCRVKDEFEPKLNNEHTAWVWAPMSNPPLPIHPGAAQAIAKFTMNEYDLAVEIMTGELTSPQQFMNIWLFAMRITGTGVSFRSKLEEYVIRDPSLYLNDYFLARCNGLPVILDHPDDDKLAVDFEEIQNRFIGSIVLPYIKGDEVWGIAKIWDQASAKMMLEKQLSTSPGVVFRPSDGNTSHEIDGAKILVEGRPSLLDHLAVCKAGVWDKGGAPTGIAVARGDSQMADEKNTDIMTGIRAFLDGFRTEMVGVLDSNMKSVKDSVAECVKKVDTFEEERKADKARRDAEEEERKDKAKKDAEEAEEKAKKDAEVAEAARIADAAKKDAEEKERMDAASRLDSAVENHPKFKAMSSQLTDLLSQVSRLPAQHTGDQKAAFADVQLRFDRAYNALGEGAPAPMMAEDLADYRRRLAKGLQQHSTVFKDADLTKISDDAALLPIETSIINDAVKAAKNPVVEAGKLHGVSRVDSNTGHKITEFYGKPGAWMGDFMAANKATSTMAIRPVDYRAGRAN